GCWPLAAPARPHAVARVRRTRGARCGHTMRLGTPWRRPTAPPPDTAFQGLSAMHAEVLKDNATLRTQLAQWQEQSGKLFSETEALRRESEHWRNMYEMALEGVRAE